MRVSSLITRLQALQETHGDVPVYAVTSADGVVAVTDTSHDVYDEDEETVIEIITEGESP